MPTIILLMIAGAAVFAWWNSARAAAEHAEKLGRQARANAEVMWLDQSVHASGIRVRRNDEGRLALERSFRFYYSYDGYDRHTGRMVLLGDRLLSFIGPVRPGASGQ